MSTRSIVGTITKAGKYQGRYVHFDGYPSARIPALTQIIARADGNLAYVIDTLNRTHTDWRFLDASSGNVEGFGDAYDVEGASLRQTYIRGSLHEDGDDVFLEWGYFFTSRDERKAELVVTELRSEGRYPNHVSRQVEVARIKVTELHKLTTRDIERIECGANWERCCHYAWAHLPEMRDVLGNIGMADLVSGEATLPCEKATHAEYQGRTWRITGSGHSGGAFGLSGRQGLWYGTLEDPETGEKVEAPLWRTNSKSDPGVSKPIGTTRLIFPDLDALRAQAGV